MTLSQLGKHSSAGVLRIGEERAMARDRIKKLSIKASCEYADCGNLSGGNQQKVVLAKWRSGGSDIMLLGHPTRGLAIGAKEDVYDMIRVMSDAGVSAVLVADTFLKPANLQSLAADIVPLFVMALGLTFAIYIGGTPLTGGVGGVLNTAVGTLIVAVIRASMLYFEINATKQQMFFGLILIVAIALTIDRAKLRTVK